MWRHGWSNARRWFTGVDKYFVFDAEVYDYDEQKCNIYANASRLHNEMIKHRLANIPIHSKIILSFFGVGSGH